MSQTAELSREELLQRYQSNGAQPPQPRPSPFKFLDSYEESDADIYFGRDGELEQLLRQFHDFGPLVIFGESGVGKSSIVQCALRTRIPEADALFIRLRVEASSLPELYDKIRDDAARQLQQPIEVPPASGLKGTLQAVRQAASRPLVLFFDRFEDLFVHHDPATRRQFASDLQAICSEQSTVKVVMSVRRDYLARLSELEDVVDDLFDNRFWLRRMSGATAAAGVLQACAAGGVVIGEPLAGSIVQQLNPGGEGVELPKLQGAMDHLCRQAAASNSGQPTITPEDVQQLGDLDQVLDTLLQRHLAALPAPEAGAQILNSFITEAATSHRISRDGIAQQLDGAVSDADLDADLPQLVDDRLLRQADDGAYELRHEALAEPILRAASKVVAAPLPAASPAPASRGWAGWAAGGAAGLLLAAALTAAGVMWQRANRAGSDAEAVKGKLDSAEQQLSDSQNLLAAESQRLAEAEATWAAESQQMSQAQTSWLADQVVTTHQLGQAHERLGDIRQAADSYGKTRELLEQLTAADPDNTRFQRQLAATVANLDRLQKADVRGALAAPPAAPLEPRNVQRPPLDDPSAPSAPPSAGIPAAGVPAAGVPAAEAEGFDDCLGAFTSPSIDTLTYTVPPIRGAAAYVGGVRNTSRVRDMRGIGRRWDAARAALQALQRRHGAGDIGRDELTRQGHLVYDALSAWIASELPKLLHELPELEELSGRSVRLSVAGAVKELTTKVADCKQRWPPAP